MLIHIYILCVNNNTLECFYYSNDLLVIIISDHLKVSHIIRFFVRRKEYYRQEQVKMKT